MNVTKTKSKKEESTNNTTDNIMVYGNCGMCKKSIEGPQPSGNKSIGWQI